MSLGDWGEGKNKKRAGDDGTGKERKRSSNPFSLPIVPRALTIPYFFTFSGIPNGSLCGVGWGGGQEVKRHFFFFKDIAKKMVRYELTNIERQEN